MPEFKPIEVGVGPQTPPAVSEVDFRPAEPAEPARPKRRNARKTTSRRARKATAPAKPADQPGTNAQEG